MKHCIYFILLLMVSSCSVQRFLPEGEKLYKGAQINITKSEGVTKSNKNLKSLVKTAISPKPNKFFLGQPWKVWWWFTIGETKREKGFQAFLKKKLGEPPVLSSSVKPKSIAENIQSLMINNGYFQSTAQGDTVNKNYFTKAIYTVHVKPPYVLDSISWVSDSSKLMNALVNARGRSILKKGNLYNLNDLKAERERLDLILKTKGYYYFNPDYLMAYADSTVGNDKVRIYLNLKKETPQQAKIAYRINKITVFPNYSLNSNTLDTSTAGAIKYKGIYVKDSLNRFKPSLFARSITYKPKTLYNSRRQNASLNRLISLGAFKFVKNRFEKSAADTTKLDVYYYLTPAPKKSLQGQIDGFTKDNNYLGTEVSINWKNRNAFKGAEQLQVKTFAGYETAFGDSLKGNSNMRLGANVSLSVPQYVLPFFRIKENNFYPPKTTFSLGYEWYRKTLLFTKNAFTAKYEFTWKKNIRTQFTLAPINLTYIEASNITDSFYRQAATNPAILLNVIDEAILGTSFNFSYLPRGRAKNKFLYNFGLDLSGNIAGLITGAKNFREKKIFGAPFAQYVKIDLGVHYTHKMPNKMEWANRLDLGIGLPYNNSKLLPFTKQYSIGGASSIRGFNTRSLGPGTYKPTIQDQKVFQIIGGDFRLLANTELRIPLNNLFSTAVFVDAGNIWTKDTLIFGKLGKLTKNFLKEIAVAAGVGFRIDLSFLLLRFDLGIPLRKPYLPKNQRWVINKFDFGSKDWRKENLILNIAIGLPF